MESLEEQLRQIYPTETTIALERVHRHLPASYGSSFAYVKHHLVLRHALPGRGR